MPVARDLSAPAAAFDPTVPVTGRPAVIPIVPVATGGPGPLPEGPGQLVSMYAKRVAIYPRAVDGWFARWRWAMVWITQAVFYLGPWLQWNGRQALLFDLEAQRFFIFGLVLVPQDLIFLAALLVISALALFFFTAVAGRLWCGYACPQTVYTEVFMWLERRIEGDRLARMRLDKAPWSAAKLARKGGKHAAWGLFSLVTGFTFVGYFSPVRELAGAAGALALSPWLTFWMLFYAGATYGNAGWLREQVCKYMCPYARFQSALIDKDSLVITYDRARGEPRGARSRKADAAAAGLGACVDCTLCVQVCPTGIDIRNGLQNECIGCAACIDACDAVMDKMGYARGLIRYATEHGVAKGLSRAQMLRRTLRPRVLVYGALLTAAGAAFAASVALRSPLRMDVIRDRGSLARVVDDGVVENVYRVQVMNRSESPRRVTLAAEGAPGLAAVATPLEVPATGIASTTLRLRLPAASALALAGQTLPVTLLVRDDAPDIGPGRDAPGALAGTAPAVSPSSGTPATSATSAVLLREHTTFLVPR